MPRSSPHTLSLFSLYANGTNAGAREVIDHPNNSHFVLTDRDGTQALDIGLQIHGTSSETVATMGRGNDVDIYLPGHRISRVQCSFEIDLQTGVVMLYDRSFSQSTQVFGEPVMPFQRGRDQRKVVVHETVNTIIGIGGEHRDLIQFRLEWRPNTMGMVTAIKELNTLPYDRFENPRFARTTDEAPTELPTRRETRVHTPGQLKMRYVKGTQLGSGQFGVVHKAIDVDSGKLMAVKILTRPPGSSQQEKWDTTLYYALKREVETLSRIKHPHIVEYIASQGWNDTEVEIFMGLKEGSLQSLIYGGADAGAVANSFPPQILKALDCIAYNGIIHRDVKPENILYVTQPHDQYLFQLGDFGLCNRTIDATSFAGTEAYMPPEMFSRKDYQTPKFDIWSLFVTMMWVLDAERFRLNLSKFKTRVETEHAISSVASGTDPTFSSIREMAIINPDERASAAQMIVKRYNGEGLTTPRKQVPPLVSPAPPPLVARNPQSNLRDLRHKPYLAQKPRRPGRQPPPG